MGLEVQAGVGDLAAVGDLDAAEAVLRGEFDAALEGGGATRSSGRARTRHRRGRRAPAPRARASRPPGRAPGSSGARGGTPRCRRAGKAGCRAGSGRAPARPGRAARPPPGPAPGRQNAPSRSSVTRFTAASPIQARHRSASSRPPPARARRLPALRHRAEIVQDVALEAGQGEPVGRSTASARPRSTRRAPARSGTRRPGLGRFRDRRAGRRVLGPVEVLGVEHQVAPGEPVRRAPVQLAPPALEQRCRRPHPGSGHGRTGNSSPCGRTRKCATRPLGGVVRPVEQVAPDAPGRSAGRAPRPPAGPPCRPDRAGPAAPAPGSAPSPGRRPRRSPRRGAGAAPGTAGCRRRSTQRSANGRRASRKAPASASASSGRSGPRSMVRSGRRPAAARQAGSSGSPSIREVMTRSAGHSATVVASGRQMRQGQRVRPVHVLDHQQARPPARPLDQPATVRRLPRLRVALSMAS